MTKLTPTHDKTNASSWGVVSDHFLRHHAETGDLLDAHLAESPNSKWGRCLKAYSLLALGQRSLRNQAHAWVRPVLSDKDTDHSAYHVAMALDLWRRDRPSDAEAKLDALLDRDPTDIFVLKIQHGLLFMQGHTKLLRKRLEKRARWYEKDNPHFSMMLGMLAFAHAETQTPKTAYQVGLQSVALDRDNAWGIHAVVHALWAMGAHQEASAWVDAHSDILAECNNFGTHVLWHQSIIWAELGRFEEALERYDTLLIPELSRDYRDSSNAISLLYRLEQLGVPVGDRWEALSHHVSALCNDHGSAFADMHYGLALSRVSGQAFDEMRGSLQRFVDTVSEGEQAAVVGDVAYPWLTALAQSRSTPIAAAEQLDSLQNMVPRVGGSRAQRALFQWVRERLTVVAEPAHAVATVSSRQIAR